MEGRKTVVVTGSNKGIGFALAESLAKEAQWHVIMACRNTKLGQESLNKIKDGSPNASIELAELDVSSTQSIDNFIKRYTESNTKFDIFVNNAGIFEFEWSLESAQRNFQTNYYGTVYLTEKVLPLVNNNGKVITLSSMLALYNFSISSQETKNKWANENITKADIDGLVKEYIDSVKEGTLAQKGYVQNKKFVFYPATKLAVNVYLQRVFARLPEVVSRGIQVYNVHPGYIATDINNNQGTGTLAQGIVSLNYLIHLPFEFNNDLQGKLFDKTQVVKLDTVIQFSL